MMAKIIGATTATGFWDIVLRLIMIFVLPWAVWTTSSIFAQSENLHVMESNRFTQNDGSKLESKVERINAALKQCNARTELEMHSIHDALVDIKETIDRVHPRVK